MPAVSVSRVIAARREEVWAALADIANSGRWNKAWSRIEITSGQTHGAGTTFRAHTEDGQAFEFEVIHWAPPEYIAFGPIRQGEPERYPLTLESHAFRLLPAGDDLTRVELIASASTHGLRGLLIGRLFWPGHQKHGLERALDSLQSLFEAAAGEEEDDRGAEGGPEAPAPSD